MSPADFIDLQEAIYWFFGPIMQSLLVVFVACGVLTGIGAIVLEIAASVSK